MRCNVTFLFSAALMSLFGAATLQAVEEGRAEYLSPNALAVAADGRTVFVTCQTAGKVVAVDLPSRKIQRQYQVPSSPSGVVVTPDAKRILVTCAAPHSSLVLLNPATGAREASIPLGHTAMAPVLSRDGQTAYVCYRFEDCVGVVDLKLKKEVHRIPVLREPVAAALSPEGKHLLVANHLHAGPANTDVAAAAVSIIDCTAAKVVKNLELPSGSSALNDIRISPDGRYAAVTHLLGRFQLPAAQLERGWMNTNAKTIIDVEQMRIIDTVLLDSVESGAATPWGVAWSQTGERLVIAHAGTHELSLIDFPGVLHKLNERRALLRSDKDMMGQVALEPANDIAFLAGLRQRVKLPPGEVGPRSVVVAGNLAVSANYFSDSLCVLDLSRPNSRPETIRLGPVVEMDEVRRGEFYFHDAGLCFETWQSCASCHPGEARVDGLNWDLLNDGIGNPKNTKSLLRAHRTPPAMSMGVRETAEMAVRAGIRNILLTVQPETVAKSIDAYLKSLEPVPSPRLMDGKLSAAAARGERVFKKAHCASCHPNNGLYTDLQSYDVGTRNSQDSLSGQFDTPSLVEVWRTAPYLHDGSAATIREVLTTHNRGDQHGVTSTLSAEELADLCEYVLSL